jgi:hypothetical protein
MRRNGQSSLKRQKWGVLSWHLHATQIAWFHTPYSLICTACATVWEKEESKTSECNQGRYQNSVDDSNQYDYQFVTGTELHPTGELRAT